MPRRCESQALMEAVLTEQERVFDPYTGVDLRTDAAINYSPSQRAGLDAPRYCQICGRRMVVQVRPDGWSALCSRHGEFDSALLDKR